MPRLIFPAALASASLRAVAVIATAVLFTPALDSQTTQSLTYNNLRTPEIQLGAIAAPNTYTLPPVAGTPNVPSDSPVSNANPASTELLATRHFDFIVSPIAEFPTPRGSIADTSISLGEYARQLRAQRQHADTPAFPNAIAQPTDSR